MARPSFAFALFLCLFAGSASALLAQENNRLTPEEGRTGWRLLFDGATASGWMEVTGRPFPTASWTVEDGSLRAVPNPDGFQDICTMDAYDSFEFQFEWKILQDGNSGVKYLVQRTDSWQRKGQKGIHARARGPEYQVVDDGSADARDATRTTGALYSVLAPTPAASLPPGRFNRSRLVVRGDHVEHWLNGVKVLVYELSQPEVMAFLRSQRRSGEEIARLSPICLQNHNSPVWFRNLKVRRLD